MISSGSKSVMNKPARLKATLQPAPRQTSPHLTRNQKGGDLHNPRLMKQANQDHQVNLIMPNEWVDQGLVGVFIFTVQQP